MKNTVTNVVIAGIGGQGVLKASDILAEAAFRAGFDVKKSEVHGMAQRGGSVHSDVRFGAQVLSPMTSPGEAHFLVVLDATQIEPNRHWLAPTGVLLTPSAFDENPLPNRKSLNIALLALLSARLSLPQAAWESAIASQMKPEILDQNLTLFRTLRQTASTESP